MAGHKPSGPAKAAPAPVAFGLPLARMDRAVTRTGRRVAFYNSFGGFVGRDYVYELPTERQAIEFAGLLETRDEDGVIWAVTEKWRQYRK